MPLSPNDGTLWAVLISAAALPASTRATPHRRSTRLYPKTCRRQKSDRPESNHKPIAGRSKWYGSARMGRPRSAVSTSQILKGTLSSGNSPRTNSTRQGIPARTLRVGNASTCIPHADGLRPVTQIAGLFRKVLPARLNFQPLGGLFRQRKADEIDYVSSDQSTKSWSIIGYLFSP
ncbi:MAG: hypothetical protein JWN34_4011 [Bryobacterales bacterium]|nr:hypothetical protein [Bryobacterales bacterium]